MCSRIRQRAGMFIILSSRYQAISLNISLLFPIPAVRKEKEHRRNHAQRRLARAFWDMKANDALSIAYESCLYFVQIQSKGALCKNKEHRAFQTFPKTTNSRFTLETIEISVIQF
jgi:hypothetical protein